MSNLPEELEAIEKNIKVSANKVADALSADVLFVNAPVERGLDDDLIQMVNTTNRRKNVFFILVTPGGDADAAYRIARCLQDSYERVTAFVSGYCKSAGTLCILGANEVVISNVGELGPLDVQLYKKDEIGELSSGLVALEALEVLKGKAFEMFEDYFMTISNKGGGQITFKTATEIAIKISVGLVEPLYKQIDPIQVGEIARSMKIAVAYGKRLMVRSKNFNERTLKMLSESYPSHGFVIDRAEANSLFKHVRQPTGDEDNLRIALDSLAAAPTQNAILRFLSNESKGDKHEKPSGDINPSIAKKAKQRSDKKGNGKNP